jgi:hypothetical protein
MMRNYLGFLLSLWLMAWPAAAAELQLGELNLSYAAPWERALVQEEEAEKSFILRWKGSGSGMTVFLPRHQVDLKVEEKRFYRQLDQAWRAQYGADVRIYPLSLAGTTWRVCRRPSLNKDATVFQLVNVYQGRAHHLLVIAPGRLETLPEAAERLAATATWGGARSEMLARSSREDLMLEHMQPLSQAEAPSQPVTDVPPAAEVPVPAVAEAMPSGAAPTPGPGIAPASPESDSPSPAVVPASAPAPAPAAVSEPEPARIEPVRQDREDGGQWRLARVIHALPQGKQLSVLAEAEKALLGHGGMLTGYGLSLTEKGHKGFLDGYVWEAGGGTKAARKTFTRNWQLDWRAPAAIGPGVHTWRLDVKEVEPGDVGGQDIGLHLEVLPLCGPRNEVLASFDALVQARANAGKRLAGLAEACQVPAADVTAAVNRLPPADGPGYALALALPGAWTGQEAGREGDVKRLVVVASHPPAEPPKLGEFLLGGVRSYFIYVPK